VWVSTVNLTGLRCRVDRDSLSLARVKCSVNLGLSFEGRFQSRNLVKSIKFRVFFNSCCNYICFVRDSRFALRWFLLRLLLIGHHYSVHSCESLLISLHPGVVMVQILVSLSPLFY
jgi:hypothetical protein